MRRVDYRLKATQICIVAGLKSGSRRKYLKILESHFDVTRIRFEGQENSWVPFKDGVFLCQALKL